MESNTIRRYAHSQGVTGPWLSRTHGRSNWCILLKTEPTQQRNFERTQQHPSQNGTTYEASNYCWHHSKDRLIKVQEQVLQRQFPLDASSTSTNNRKNAAHHTGKITGCLLFLKNLPKFLHVPIWENQAILLIEEILHHLGCKKHPKILA